MAVQPWFSVYRAGDLQIVCYRSVSANPAPPEDFLSYAAMGKSYPWSNQILANGVSAWEDAEVARRLAKRVLSISHRSTRDFPGLEQGSAGT
jgi:hypothetical protein